MSFRCCLSLSCLSNRYLSRDQISKKGDWPRVFQKSGACSCPPNLPGPEHSSKTPMGGARLEKPARHTQVIAAVLAAGACTEVGGPLEHRI